jgi:hypothetical protein
MILCCDIINLVRRASKDIKISKALNRKRSETTRELSNGRFTIVDHHRDGNLDAQQHFHYERDTINKGVKITEVDNQLLNHAQKVRTQKINRGNSKDGFTGASPLRHKRFSTTSSRFNDIGRISHSNCHRHAHFDEEKAKNDSMKLADYAPLRTNNG